MRDLGWIMSWTFKGAGFGLDNVVCDSGFGMWDGEWRGLIRVRHLGCTVRTAEQCQESDEEWFAGAGVG